MRNVICVAVPFSYTVASSLLVRSPHAPALEPPALLDEQRYTVTFSILSPTIGRIDPSNQPLSRNFWLYCIRRHDAINIITIVGRFLNCNRFNRLPAEYQLLSCNVIPLARAHEGREPVRNVVGLFFKLK